MKITKSYLKQIIKEELQNVSLEEQEQLEEVSFKGILAGAALIGTLVAAGMSGESAKESLQKMERDPAVVNMLKNQ
jgi:putative IMPACT (imprinted ancient) family translation regulator